MAVPSLTATLLETEGVDPGDAKWVSGAMYVAGSDTVRLTFCDAVGYFLKEWHLHIRQLRL